MTDNLLLDAAEIVIRTQFCSYEMLQRKLHVSFAESLHLLDRLEAVGIVGPAQGLRAREVLVIEDQRGEALDKIREEAVQ